MKPAENPPAYLLPASPKDVKFQVWNACLASFGRRLQETDGYYIIFGFICRHTGKRYHQKMASFQILVVAALVVAYLDGHLWFISAHSLRKDVALTYCLSGNTLLTGNEGRAAAPTLPGAPFTINLRSGGSAHSHSCLGQPQLQNSL